MKALRRILFALCLGAALPGAAAGQGPPEAEAEVPRAPLLVVRARTELRLSEADRQIRPSGRLTEVHVQLELRDSGADLPLAQKTIELSLVPLVADAAPL